MGLDGPDDALAAGLDDVLMVAGAGEMADWSTECFFTCAYSTAGSAHTSSISSIERLRRSGMSMCGDGVDCFCFTMKSVTVQLADRVGLLGNALFSGLVAVAVTVAVGVDLTGLVGTYDDEDERDDSRGLTSGGIDDDI